MKRMPMFVLASLVAMSLATLALAQQKTPSAKKEPPKTEQKPMTVVAPPVGANAASTLSKEEITAVQAALKKAGIYKSEVSGTWDKATTEALRQYQTQNKLKPTGEPNHETLAKLGIKPHAQHAARHHADTKNTGDKKTEHTIKNN